MTQYHTHHTCSANRLLAALPEHEYRRLEPYLIYQPLSIGTVLYEGFEKIETVYFPHSALISLVNTLSNGTTTEIGIIGGTGMIGLAALISDGYSNQRAVVQMADGCSKNFSFYFKTGVRPRRRVAKNIIELHSNQTKRSFSTSSLQPSSYH